MDEIFGSIRTGQSKDEP